MASTKRRQAVLTRRENSLFGAGPNDWLNACVGHNGGFAGFDRIAYGYFEAGQILVECLQEDRRHLDTLIYPLVQTYRHGVETMLKHLVPLLGQLCDGRGGIAYTHKLVDNWQIVRDHLLALEIDESEFAEVDEILGDLVEIDATGETFRYPSARDGARHLEGTSHINVERLADGMAVLKTFFDACCCWASEELDIKMELESHLGG